ncbi:MULTISPECIES: fumarylacetoacetate hydrolase family protein [unclassified Sphingobium]|uniref:fumarylacetoacetate hydrolase family protein n=1 Tax=unclassified Sphingobium TaxID=2611147 RepID=UPI000770347D|nr:MULTISPECIES: fumarylacetoacetate hydrolase family protein [unclassified Sphingobium]AMK25293.1 fumarylacetoacetate hydrolase [Sphingobium sp. TKS]NML87949.1 fumarylacetoacetate hydrolase family protein [Sphingobium sp. TB-6]
MTNYALSVVESGGRPVVALETGGAFYDLSKAAPDLQVDASGGILSLLQNWDRSTTILDDIAASLAGCDQAALPKPDDGAFQRLVTHPSKLIFAGLNYYDHLRIDLGITDFDKESLDPLLFLKHQGAQAASGQELAFPIQTQQLDWEVELVVIFGKSGRAIPRAEAMNYIAGYAVGVDLSARDWQNSKRHMREFDLFAGKAFDGASPVGPLFVPAQFVDSSNLGMKLWVNGELKQDSNSDQMIWSIPELIEWISRHMTIEPGDMLFTGSPAGVGLISGTYLKPGDEVRAEIAGLGILTTRLSS